MAEETRRERLAARVLTTPARRERVQRLLDEYMPRRGTGRVALCLLGHESCPIPEHYVRARERQAKERVLKPGQFGKPPEEEGSKRPVAESIDPKTGVPYGYERITRGVTVPDPKNPRKRVPLIEVFPEIANLYEAELDDYLQYLNEEDKANVRAAAKEYQERLRERTPTGEIQQVQFGTLAQLTRTLEIERPYFQLLNIPGTRSPYGTGPKGRFARVRVPGTRVVLDVDLSPLSSREERRKYPGKGPLEDRRVWAAIDAYMARQPGEFVVEQLEPERRRAWWGKP